MENEPEKKSLGGVILAIIIGIGAVGGVISYSVKTAKVAKYTKNFDKAQDIINLSRTTSKSESETLMRGMGYTKDGVSAVDTLNSSDDGKEFQKENEEYKFKGKISSDTD